MQTRIITKELVRKFKQHLYEEERSENTIAKYMRDIGGLVEYAEQKELQKADILEYKRKLCATYAPQSVNSMLSSINSFFVFVEWHELKVKTLKIQRQLYMNTAKELTKSEYERLLMTAKNKKDRRLYYLMQTMAGTGLRVSELQYVTVEAVSKGQATICCREKIRQVFLPKLLCKMLTEYARERHIKTGSIFVTKSGIPLDRSNVWKMVKVLCADAGVSPEKVFPHNFRHLFARTFYSVQKNIVHLADILGHSSVNTTRIYTMETGETHRLQIQELGLLQG